MKQKIAIPTYFESGAAGEEDWAGAASAGSLLAMAIINPANGPGYTSSYLPGGTKHAEYQQRMHQMQAAGADVLGYVTTNYRDSRSTSVQAEHRFTADAAAGVVTTRDASGAVNSTGWTRGFGPVQVRSAATLPDGLAVSTDYYWIDSSPTTGAFATSKSNATAGIAAPLTSNGDPGSENTNHVMGLSRTPANISNVFFEIDTFYERWPDIDGMFFDEMDNIDDTDNLNYYKQVFDHVRTKGGKARVVQNPGQSFPESMINIADVFMAFESHSSHYGDYDPAWRMNYPAARFWHAIHSCPVADMPTMIELSRAKNAGYIYVTDRVHPDQNVWLHIAANFAEEIAKVASQNAIPPAEVVPPSAKLE